MLQSLTKKPLALGLALLAMLLMGLWLHGQIRDPAPVPTKAQVPHIPDFTIENFEAVALDEQGVPRHRLFSPELLHFADDATASVVQPKIIVYNVETPPWEMVAEQGWLSADGNELQLTGAVKATRERDQLNEAITIDTRDVDVDLQTDVAVTEADAVIVSDSSVTESVGMQARLAKNRLLLSERVRGVYEVPEPQ